MKAEPAFILPAAGGTSFPAAGEAVIFQPEFVEFGGEERVILALSEGLHARALPHSVLCYRDHIDLARHARLPLRVHQLRPSGPGLARALANNAIVGVTEGFKKELDVVGVGYKADVQGKKIVFALGYSHPIEYPLPEGIDAKAERINTKTSINQYQTTITLSGIDKQKLGQVAAELNRLRKPDAYKGKGVRYADKYYRLKPGKTGK